MWLMSAFKLNIKLESKSKSKYRDMLKMGIALDCCYDTNVAQKKPS